MTDDEGFVSLDDAAMIGSKVVEMADRVSAMHAIVPSSEARWRFELDGREFDIVVRVAPTSDKDRP